MKKFLKLFCTLLVAICIFTCIPVTTQAKAKNPFASQTQERPLLTGGKYLRILTAEIACNAKALKQLYKYYINNIDTYKYVVIDFGNDEGLICNKKNKTFVYGTLKKNTKTNGYKISKKKGTIKIKGKSVIRKTGNRFLD